MFNWFDTTRGAAPRAADPFAHLPTGPRDLVRRIVNIYGVSGEGKTYYMAWLYRRSIESGGSGTFVDTTHGNSYLARSGESSHHRAIARTPQGWLAHVRDAHRSNKPFNIILQCDSWRLDEFWPLLLRVGNQVCAIDEMDEYAPSSVDLKGTPLGRLISQGRHKQISMISTVRVPPELNKPLRGVADVTVSFRQAELDYAKVIARDSMRSAHPRLAELLLALPTKSHKFIRYRAGKIELGQAPRI